MKTTKAILSIILGICTCSSAFADPGAMPTAGFYRAEVYTTAATPAQTCTTDGTTLHSSFVGTFYYPGPGQHGAFFEQPASGSSGGTVYVHRYHAKTPAKGETGWSGMVNIGYAGEPRLFDIPFTATVTYLDEYSFKEMLTFTGSGCTRTYQIVMSRSG